MGNKFNAARLGVDYDTGRAAYSISKCITIIMIEEDWTELEAVEWFYYSIVGDNFGATEPIWIDDVYENKIGRAHV